MEENRGLKYKTRGNVSPRGKTRIFFCCHPDDFDLMFEPISQQILDTQVDAAIWYYDPDDGAPTGKSFLAELSQMQLFVVAVTAKFINDENSARCLEFAYAVDHHIPLLPLMQEPGLGSAFASVCGNIPYLDKFASSNDPTDLPYAKKLKQYLESVLVRDETAQKIKDTFDANIFQNYRDEDGKDSQDSNQVDDSWYKDFLASGENFNDAIEANLKKNSLFGRTAASVRLKNPQYKEIDKYSEEKEREKKALLSKRQDEIRQELFRLLTSSIDEEDEERIEEALSAYIHKYISSGAFKHYDDDPVQNYLIGYAYLLGIDVEKDLDKAISLFTSAAEAGLIEAIAILVAIYQGAFDDKKDYDSAIKWQKQMVTQLKSLYEESPGNDSLLAVVMCLKDLGEYQKDNDHYNDAKASFQEMIGYAKELNDAETNVSLLLTCAYSGIGDINKTQGNLEEAKTWYIASLPVFEEFIEKTGSNDVCYEFPEVYRKLGDICKDEGHLEEARSWYLKSLPLYEKLVKETDTIESVFSLSSAYNQLGEISKAENNLVDARSWYLKSLPLREDLARDTKTTWARQNLLYDYQLLGNLCKSTGELEDARFWYQKGLSSLQKYLEETDDLSLKECLAVFYYCLGTLPCVSLNERIIYITKMGQVGETLFKQTGLAKHRRYIKDARSLLEDIAPPDEDQIDILSKQMTKDKKIQEAKYRILIDYIHSGKDPNIVSADKCPDVVRDALQEIKYVRFEDVCGIDYRKGGFFSKKPQYILYAKTGLASNYSEHPLIQYEKILAVKLTNNGVAISTSMGKRFMINFKKANKNVYDFLNEMVTALKKIRIMD